MDALIEKWLSILERSYLGNPVAVWALSLLVVVVSFLVLRGAVRWAGRRLQAVSEARQSKLLGLFAEVLGKTSALTLLFAAVLAGAQFLQLPAKFEQLLRSLLVVLALLQGGVWATLLLERWLAFRISSEKEAGRSTAVTLASFAGKLLLWAFILLLSLENLGVDVTALIAGLGVGGIAVALATQGLLADLLGSVTIALDKPFEVGDLIIVEDLSGTVEHIGLKTTRVRSIYGEQIVFSNADLLASRIRNYKRMSERRVVFSLGVEYNTPPERLRKVPEVVAAAFAGLPDLRFERAYLKEFGESNLNFEVVFFVLTPDIGVYMDRLHAVNLAIYDRFAAERLEMSYPVQEVILRKPDRALSPSAA
jgi:small-conductance mechanosensitive channel